MRAASEVSIRTGRPAFDSLYPAVRGFLEHDQLDLAIDGQRIRGYRTPDARSVWIRDHSDMMRGFRYFEPDLTSAVQHFADTQSASGRVFDYFTTFPEKLPSERENWTKYVRVPVEADVEYRLVKGAYLAWQASGDDGWIRGLLPNLERAMAYIRSHPWYWDDGPRPGEARLHDRHVGLRLHGGSSRLAPVPDHRRHVLGPDARRQQRLLRGVPPAGPPVSPLRRRGARAVVGRARGRHPARPQRRVLERPLLHPLRQADAGDHRGRGRVVSAQPEQPDGHQPRGGQTTSRRCPFFASTGGAASRPARSRSGSPSTRRFPTGSSATSAWWPGRTATAGSCRWSAANWPARRSSTASRRTASRFSSGTTGSSRRRARRISGTSPTGGRAAVETSTSPDALPTDGWGSSAMLWALVEGLAGVVDDGRGFDQMTLSPRWLAAGVSDADVSVGYAASGRGAAYSFRHRRGSDRARRRDAARRRDLPRAARRTGAARCAPCDGARARSRSARRRSSRAATSTCQARLSDGRRPDSRIELR